MTLEQDKIELRLIFKRYLQHNEQSGQSIDTVVISSTLKTS